MTDAPTPIPTEGVWTGDPADLPNWDAMPRRNRRRKRRGHTPIWVRYALSLVALAVVVIAAQIAYHALRSDPRNARVFAERELRLSVLHADETVLGMVSVWQRPAIDYFRATKGLLVLTDAPGDTARPVGGGGRVIYLGLQPRDPLSPAGAPPTFDEREWVVDTLVTLAPRRTFFLFAPGLRVSTPREHVTLGLPGDQDDAASALRALLTRKHNLLKVEGYRRREIARGVERARRMVLYEGRRAWYHTVRHGDALASIAKLFNTTPEELRRLNGIEGDRIRIGQTLIVKGWTKNVVPTPAGATPEYAPEPAAATPPAAAPPVAAPGNPQ